MGKGVLEQLLVKCIVMVIRISLCNVTELGNTCELWSSHRPLARWCADVINWGKGWGLTWLGGRAGPNTRKANPTPLGRPKLPTSNAVDQSSAWPVARGRYRAVFNAVVAARRRWWPGSMSVGQRSACGVILKRKVILVATFVGANSMLLDTLCNAMQLIASRKGDKRMGKGDPNSIATAGYPVLPRRQGFDQSSAPKTSSSGLERELRLRS